MRQNMKKVNMEKIRFDEPGIHKVGTIVLNNEVYITDPCYDTDT